MAPNGIQMMLKAFGFDPQQIIDMANAMQAGLVELNTRLERVEQQQQEILDLLHKTKVKKETI